MIIRINWREIHHAYFGAALFVLGPVLVGFHKWPTWAGFLCAAVGFWLMADDLYQHWRNVTQPEYKSLVHRLFCWCWDSTFGTWWPFGKL